jgi:hypothetical protein
MPSVPAALFAKLSDATSATSALVGPGTSCRVYPEIAPNFAPKPYVVFHQVSFDPGTTHNEGFQTATRLFQFSCYASTYAEAIAVRDAVVADLDNATLSSGDAPIVQDERSSYEEAVDLHRADADFLV